MNLHLFSEKLPNPSLLLFWQINETLVATTLPGCSFYLVLGSKRCLQTPGKQTPLSLCRCSSPLSKAAVVPVMPSTFDAWAIFAITEVTHDVISNANVSDDYSGMEPTQQFQSARRGDNQVLPG